MNKLKPEKQATVISMLTEGNSVRSVERMTGVHRDTIIRLMVRVGEHCETMLAERMDGIPCETIQADELWTYVYKKQRRVLPSDPTEFGDCYGFIGFDPASKVIIHHRMGKRSAETTELFVAELAERVPGRVTIFTDGWGPYIGAIRRHFGPRAGYAQVIKHFDGDRDEHRYSPPKVTHMEEKWIQGRPSGRACTSHVERLNWSVRTYCRRFVRLSNGFSRKARNLRAAMSLFVAWYNFVKPHKSLGGSTPAMAAGIVSGFWKVADLIPN